jgi:hypothetical protein
VQISPKENIATSCLDVGDQQAPGGVSRAFIDSKLQGGLIAVVFTCRYRPSDDDRTLLVVLLLLVGLWRTTLTGGNIKPLKNYSETRRADVVEELHNTTCTVPRRGHTGRYTGQRFLLLPAMALHIRKLNRLPLTPII